MNMKPKLMGTAPDQAGLAKMIGEYLPGNPPPVFNADGTISRLKNGVDTPYDGWSWRQQGGRFRWERAVAP